MARTKNKLESDRTHRPWSQNDLDILYDKYGLWSDKTLAKKLGRTVLGVRLKASRLHLLRTQNFMTASDVARIMQVSPSLVMGWLYSKDLKGRKSSVGGSGRSFWRVDYDALETFIQTRHDLFDPLKIDRSPHPYWKHLAEKSIPKDFVITNGRHWSEFEDAYLLNHRQDMTIPELAVKLKRTKEAVHGRLVLLRRKGYMMPYKELWQTRKANGTDKAPAWFKEQVG